jgi:hypothetical protein
VTKLDLNHNPSMPYTAQWEEYRKQRRLVWALILTYVPGALLLGSLLARLFQSQVFFFVPAVAWMIAIFVFAQSTASWPCPRCGERFFQSTWYHNSFAQRCVHCKLPKWADGP